MSWFLFAVLALTLGSGDGFKSSQSRVNRNSARLNKQESSNFRQSQRLAMSSLAESQVLDNLPKHSSADSISPPPPCLTNTSDLAYVQGQLSATQTFYNCINNIPDGGMIATYYNATYNGVLIINTSIILNNLEYIDEIQGIARLQFTVKLYWKDDRFAMPVFWNLTSPVNQAYGIDLTNIMVTNTSIVIWTPELRFPDAADIEYHVQYLKLNSSNVFFWSAALDATLVQPKFNFRDYPSDEQTVNIRYIVYNFDSSYVQLNFNGGDGIVFNEYYDGSYTFQSNAIWNYQSSTYSTFLGNGFTYALYQINVKRLGSGIVLRLVLPITLLLLLAGLTFWVTLENRVDTTITLLLSISALYIVILTNIPLVGYLTNVDKYVFWMFLLLVGVVVLHQTYATLHNKKERWPLRNFYMRLIESFGRVLLIPFVLIYYVGQIESSIKTSIAAILIAFSAIYMAAISAREMVGLKSAYGMTMVGLVEKFNDPSTTMAHVSWLEVLVINVLIFHEYSISTEYLASHLAKHEKIVYDKSQGMRLKDINIIGRSSDVNEPKEQSKRATTGASIELASISASPFHVVHHENASKNAAIDSMYTSAKNDREEGYSSSVFRRSTNQAALDSDDEES